MNDRRALVALRIATAAMFFIHGVARAHAGAVAPFGAWLDSLGFPYGIAWAWAVTAIEIVGSPLLALGRYATPIAVYLIAQTALGIYLVHAPAGWFVVGLGRNGAEYSVLLIVCLAVIAATHGKRR